MGRPKEIKDGTRLSVVLSKQQVERVKYMALRMSTQEGRQITCFRSYKNGRRSRLSSPKKPNEHVRLDHLLNSPKNILKILIVPYF